MSASLLLALLLSQNGVSVTNRTADKAVAVRCVGTDGGWESCGGAGGTYTTNIGTLLQGVGLDGGGAWNVAGVVAVSNLPATQPVSGSVSVSNLPSTQAVSGTFWPAIQPASQSTGEDGGRAWNVAGTVAVSNFPATTAVTGPLTDTQLRATPVPVSGTVTANAGSGTLAVSIASMPTTPVTGAFFQASQPVAATQGPAADGGTGWAVRVNAVESVVYVYSVAPPLNPFLPRCNAVRRLSCQP